MNRLALLIWMAAATLLRGEEVAELEPVAVTATLELRQQPPAFDRLSQYLSREIEQHRARDATRTFASPWWESHLWNYLPRVSSSDGDLNLLLTPTYLRPEFRALAQPLRDSERHSLFRDK